MSKPTLADLPPRYQDQVARQLYGTPHPRTVAIEAVQEPQRRAFARRKADPLRFAPFLRALSLAGIPAPVVEHKFAQDRRWRFDFAWFSPCVAAETRPTGWVGVAVEVEGGVWVGGRHTRGKGFLGDCEKYNRAQELGWCVLRYPPQQLTRAETLQQIRVLVERVRL
jgi:hypothetical protein